MVGENKKETIRVCICVCENEWLQLEFIGHMTNACSAVMWSGDVTRSDDCFKVGSETEQCLIKAKNFTLFKSNKLDLF